MPDLMFSFFFGFVCGLMFGAVIALVSITTYLDWLNK